MKRYPAVDARCDSLDVLLTIVDDFAPTAIEDRGDSTRVFFSTPDARDLARAALAAAHCAAVAQDVDDEDWARRSQAHLGPVTVGRITILPRPHYPSSERGGAGRDEHFPIEIVIEPSMGFGTGHHASTRLCLAALQEIDLTGRTVLDVGTGSGVLAIAAARLGARRSVGIDSDPDAVDAAARNLPLNPSARHVDFRVADLATDPLPEADVVVANLTGALLIRAASRLVNARSRDGVLIVGGLLDTEKMAVRDACLGVKILWERQEDEWAALMLGSS